MGFPQARERPRAELVLLEDRWCAGGGRVVRQRVGGDEHDDRWQSARCDLACRLGSPDAWHTNVHQDQVWPKTFGLLDRFFAGAPCADPFETGGGADQLASNFVKNRMVIDDQNADRSSVRSPDRHYIIVPGARPRVHSAHMCDRGVGAPHRLCFSLR